MNKYPQFARLYVGAVPLLIRCSDIAMKCYLILVDDADRDDNAEVTRKEIAATIGVSTRQVQRGLVELVDAGLVVRKLKRRACPTYRIEHIQGETQGETPRVSSKDQEETPQGTKGRHPVSPLNGFDSLVNQKKERESQKPSPSSQFQDYWNRVAVGAGLPAIRIMTKSRQATLRIRIADDDWRDHWQEAIQTLTESAFCRGENERGWKADVDWFLKPSTLTKVLEGKYTDSTNGNTNEPKNLLDTIDY